MRFVNASLASAVLAAILCASGSAAADASPADKALAEGLFQEAKKLMNAGKTSEACPKLAESHRLVPKLGTLLNLATCHEDEGKTASAWAEFTEGASMATKAKEPARAKYAREHAEALEKKLSRLLVEVKSPAAGIEVKLAGKPIGQGAWGTAVPLDPGEYTVEATAPGKKPFSTTARLEPGPTTLKVEVPPLADEIKAEAPAGAAEETTAKAATAPPKDGGAQGGGFGAQRGAGVAVLGLGLVGVGVGAYFGVRTISLKDESAPHCNGELCDQAGVDLRRDARTSSTISTVAIGAGAACVVGGLVLLLTAKSSGSGAKTSQVQDVWVAPAVGKNGVGLGMGGVW